MKLLIELGHLTQRDGFVVDRAIVRWLRWLPHERTRVTVKQRRRDRRFLSETRHLCVIETADGDEAFNRDLRTQRSRVSNLRRRRRRRCPLQPAAEGGPRANSR